MCVSEKVVQLLLHNIAGQSQGHDDWMITACTKTYRTELKHSNKSNYDNIHRFKLYFYHRTEQNPSKRDFVKKI